MRAARLRRMKAVALGFLLAAVALLVLAHANGRTGIWGWIGAFAEAATIGALADWFAVVALFRHPLGLPIPHTAIIPRNHGRIADTLARFIGEHFLARERLLERVVEWNPAHKLGVFLATPERLAGLSRQLRRWAAQALAALDSPEVETELQRIVRDQLARWDAASTGAQLVRALTHGEHHQRLLNAALVQVSDWVGREEVRDFMTVRLIALGRREYPRLLWIADRLRYTEALGDAVSARLAQAIIDETLAVLRDPAHPLRQRYSEEAGGLLDGLEHDAALQQRVAGFKQRLLDSPVLADYVAQLWARLRAWLHADLAREDSVAMARFDAIAARLGQRLRDDPLWQATANEQFSIAAHYLADQLREVAPRYIRETVDAWDTRFLVEEIERSVGRDLQFIRLNGTVIGGLAGVALYALFQLPWARWLG